MFKSCFIVLKGSFKVVHRTWSMIVIHVLAADLTEVHTITVHDSHARSPLSIWYIVLLALVLQ